jgi:hypothetical protein
MIAREIHYEMTKLLTSLSPDEINCIKGMKYIITNLADKDLKILVKILLGNRYNEFIERIKGE